MMEKELRIRCIACGTENIPLGTADCPNPKCKEYLPALLRDFLRPGTLLHDGKYEIDCGLGRGGFGITYRGRHRELGGVVAIKEFFPVEDASRHTATAHITVAPAKQERFDRWLDRFCREGRILAGLEHPGVVGVRDLFKERGTAYLVMNLVRGRTLRAEMDEARRLPAARVEAITGGLVDALEAVHAAGVFHLDVSPENVLVKADGAVVLIDFGAARQEAAMRSSRAYRRMYAAPELLLQKEVGAETDLYELAMVVHEMLTGEVAELGSDGAWKAEGLVAPWDGLLGAALRWDRKARTASVREWWNGRMGADGGRTAPEPAAVRPRVVATPPPKPSPSPVVLPARPAVVVAARTPAEGTVRVNPVDGAEMVYVPAGPFLMGDADQRVNPRRTVTLDAYWMYKTAVTVGQYRKFCQARGRAMPAAPVLGWKEDHPVVNVNWDDAAAYCGWVQAQLPTEAQWEKAARGTDGRKYPWGNDWDPGKLQCSKNAGGDAGSTAPVGRFPAGASPYGCLDMAGNVWEWCADWYGDLNSAPTTNPNGPATGQYRVLRGGSWKISDGGPNFRCAHRGSGDPAGRYGSGGFRAVGGVRAD